MIKVKSSGHYYFKKVFQNILDSVLASSSKLKETILFLVPITLLLVWILFRDSMCSFLGIIIDPEYAYLLNGLIMIENNLKVDFYDHPGTILELLIAIIIKIFSFFRNDEISIDLLQNPELYLHTINTVIFFILLFAIIVIGKRLYTKTGNLSLAILIQATPLFFGISHYTSRLIPETIFIIEGLVFIYLIINYLEDKNLNQTQSGLTFSLGVISGIILATKISFFPLILLPLFIMSERRKRLLYIIYTMLAFFVFAYPVTLNLNAFFQWMKSILTHTGRYGYGEKGFIDWSDFIANGTMLIKTYRTVFFLFMANLLVLLYRLVLKFKKPEKKPEQNFVIFAGLTLVIVLQFILVSKHFALHYFLPVLLIVPLNIYLIIRLIFSLVSYRKIKFFEKFIYFIPLVMVCLSLRQYIVSDTTARYQSKENRETTINFINSYNKTYPLAINSGAWNPYPEFGLWFGSLFTKKYRTSLLDRLNKIYPNRYFYVDHMNCYIDWYNNQFSINNLISKYDTVLIYYNRPDKSKVELDPILSQPDSFLVKTLLDNQPSSELLVEINKK